MHDFISFENFLGMRRLDEASFGIGNLKKISNLYGKLFGRALGCKLFCIGSEEFKGANGDGKGVRFLSDTGIQLRIDFSDGVKGLNQKFAKDSLFLSGIEYWANGNNDLAHPTLSAKFTQDVNVIKIYKSVLRLLKSNSTGRFKPEELISEASPQDIRKQFIAANKDKFQNKGCLAYRPSEFSEYIEDLGLTQDWDDYIVSIKQGGNESNSVDSDVKGTTKKLDSKPYADPKRVFSDIEKLTRLVGKGVLKSLIVCGLGGVGKTYHVTKIMSELGTKNKDWLYFSGARWTPAEFYKATLLGRNKTIVYDEADDVLGNKDIVMMLKPCLDTSGENTMEYKPRTLPTIGWSRGQIENYCGLLDNAVYKEGKALAWKVSTKNKPGSGEDEEDDEADVLDQPYIPDKFYFNGQMIFISNMASEEIESAIKSRSIYVDVYLHITDIIQRIKDIAIAKYAKSGEYSEEFVLSFVDKICNIENMQPDQNVDGVTYLTPTYVRKHIKPPTVRTIVLAFDMLRGGMSPEDAADLANMYA